MTTVTSSPVLTPASTLTRVWNVVRLHSVNRAVYFGIPWLVIGAAWAVSMLISALILYSGADPDNMNEGMGNSWAVISPLWYMCAVAVLAIAQSFPFALGFGVTRRDFYLGTSLMFLLTSVANGVALATLATLEEATNGWGLRTRMFTALFFSDTTWLSNAFVFTVIQLCIFFIGACVATVYMRWRVWGMLIFWSLFAIAVLGSVTFLSLTEQWGRVGRWFAGQSTVSVFAWLLVLVAIAAVTGFAILRRATPKN